MFINRTKFRNATKRTLLIILGVIIALLMTWNSPLFSTEEVSLPTRKVESNVARLDQRERGNAEEKSTSSGLNSTALLFHSFTHNLPFLNNK